MLSLISLMAFVLCSFIVSLENITTYLNSFKLHAADISLFIYKMQDLFSRNVLKLVNLVSFLKQRYIPNVIASG